MNPNITAPELVDASWLRVGITANMPHPGRDAERLKAESIVGKIETIASDSSLSALGKLHDVADDLDYFATTNEFLYTALIELCAARLREARRRTPIPADAAEPDPMVAIGHMGRAASDLSQAWLLTY